MITKISITAGQIWLELDKFEGVNTDDLLKRLEDSERSKDMLLMALGWLIYQRHVKWIPGMNGGKLFLVRPLAREELKDAKSYQNDFAASNA